MSADASRYVLVRRHGAIAEIVIGDGRRRNALPSVAWSALEHAVDDLASDDDVRAIAVRGRGATFCSGSDLTEWAGADTEAVEESFARMEAAFRAVERCPVPVLAAIEGAAAGAGCQLALACDLRFMAASARIGMPIARLGILATPAFAARLVTLAGPATAREMLYTGHLLGAREAVDVGLVNRVVPDHTFGAEVDRTLAAVAAQPAAAVRAAKHAVSRALAPIRSATARSGQPAVHAIDFAPAVTSFHNRTSAALGR